MEFLSAISGWQWVLAGAVPVGIVALYFLKLKRKPVQVPSTFLWLKSVEDLHVNSLWQRLRKNILLLLQLLVVAAVILALARPMVDATQTGKYLIFLIDNSASMAATDVEPSRLAVAKQKAIEVAQQMQRGDSAMVIAFADTARVVCSYTQNVPTVVGAIRSIEQTARRTDLREAFTIAGGLANPQRAGEDDAEAVPATLYVVSDGRFPQLTDLSLGNLRPKFIGIGDSARNLGLLALSARRSESRPDELDVFARVVNFAGQSASFTVELAVDDRIVDMQRGEVAANDFQPIVFRLTAPEQACLSMRLDVEDDFALDNQGWTVVNPPRKARLLVVGEENVVLKASLQTQRARSLADVRYASKDFCAKNLADESMAGEYDLMIFDRCAPMSMPPCNTFFVDAVPPELAALTKTEVKGPVILNWASHPVLRFLNLSDVNVISAFTLRLPRGATELIESNQGALLFALPRGVFTDLVQSFALIDDRGYWQTDWPSKLSFPLYILNIVRTLGGAGDEQRTTLQAGDPVSFRSETDVVEAIVTYPSGRSSKVRRSRQGRFEFLDTEELGSYRAEIGQVTWHFAVNLFDEEESSIEPAKELQLGSELVTDVSAEVIARRELWKPLTVLALVLLLLEWYVYNRRVYV